MSLVIRFQERDLTGGSYIPEGVHEVTVKDVKQETSKAGNPQLLVSFKDQFGREGREYLSLSESAKWKIASFAVAAGFAKEALANAGLPVSQLVGKKLTLNKKKVGVRTTPDGKQRTDYSNEFFPTQNTTAPDFDAEDEMPF